MSDKLKVCYLGDDIGYWKKLQSEYKDVFSGTAFEFVRHETHKGWSPKKVFCEILDLRVKILYVDFSLDNEKCMELCKLLRKDSTTKRMSTTALHQYNDFEENLPKALMAGIRINHIKSGEVADVVYDGMCLYDVEKTAPPEFATAQAQIISTAIQDLRVGYVDNQKFHIETKSPLVEGQVLELNDHFLEQQMPCKTVEVHNQTDRNLYYDLRYSYDLMFDYVDRVNPERYEQITDADMLAKIKEQDAENRLEGIKEVKANIDNWLDFNSKKMSPPKRVKIMVVDRTLTLIRDDSINLESFDYTMILQSRLQGEREQLKRFMSHVIIYNFEKPMGAEPDDETINGVESLRAMVKTIERIENYTPIIVVFNAGEEAGKIKNLIPYKKILVNPSPMDVELINGMAKKFLQSIVVAEDKEEEAMQAAAENGEAINFSKKVYFRSSEKESIIHLKRPIKIIEVNEICIYFECPEEIPSFTCFRMKYPFSAVLTVVPVPSSSPHSGKDGVYYAMLNGIGEDEKKDVRQAINKWIYEKDNPPPEDDDGLSLWEKREKEKKARVAEEEEKKRVAAEKAAAAKKAEEEEKARMQAEQQAELAAKQTEKEALEAGGDETIDPPSMLEDE